MTVTTVRVPYAGIATRAVALAIDAAIAQAIVFVIGAVCALVASLVGNNIDLNRLGAILAAVAWAVIFGFYFVVFWSTTGQTPGMRMMGLRVIDRRGAHPGLIRSSIRLVGLALAIIPLGAGFLPVLVDDRRRALQDFLAGTTVIYDVPSE
jgi:uncharacterized RDD family membrane protein YckC